MQKLQGRPRKACNVCKKQKVLVRPQRSSSRRLLTVHSRSVAQQTDHAAGDAQDSITRVITMIAGSQINQTLWRGVAGQERHCFQVVRSLWPLPVGLLYQTPDENCSEIPSSLVNALVELYFNNVYQSNLLLHKDSFIKSLADSAVQPHVLLSMYALGAK